ncbi:hypothetical protein NC651_003065 [Populus alba x Populus x berolinensis]|nr:hypothetical protein NC651_003065 [Populus alba x Populus x berolinensis]
MDTAMTSRASHFELKFLKSQEADITQRTGSSAHMLCTSRESPPPPPPATERRDIHKHRRPDI